VFGVGVLLGNFLRRIAMFVCNDPAGNPAAAIRVEQKLDGTSRTPDAASK